MRISGENKGFACSPVTACVTMNALLCLRPAQVNYTLHLLPVVISKSSPRLPAHATTPFIQTSPETDCIYSDWISGGKLTAATACCVCSTLSVIVFECRSNISAGQSHDPRHLHDSRTNQSMLFFIRRTICRLRRTWCQPRIGHFQCHRQRGWIRRLERLVAARNGFSARVGNAVQRWVFTLKTEKSRDRHIFFLLPPYSEKYELVGRLLKVSFTIFLQYRQLTSTLSFLARRTAPELFRWRWRAHWIFRQVDWSGQVIGQQQENRLQAGRVRTADFDTKMPHNPWLHNFFEIIFADFFIPQLRSVSTSQHRTRPSRKILFYSEYLSC